MRVVFMGMLGELGPRMTKPVGRAQLRLLFVVSFHRVRDVTLWCLEG